MDASAIWGVGDTVTYAIDIDDGGVHHGFTFTLTTTRLPAPETGWCDIVHPAHGRILTRTAEENWQTDPWFCFDGAGPATLRAELLGDDGSSCSGVFEQEAIAHLWVDDLGIGMRAGVHELFHSLLGLDCMHATLLRVIRQPSFLSILGRLGSIEVGLEWPEIDELPVVEQDTPFGRLPMAWRPITIEANGQPGGALSRPRRPAATSIPRLRRTRTAR